MRFFAAKSGLSEQDLDFLTSADGSDHIALGAVRLNALDEEAEALGFARCIRLDHAPESAEVSIGVADRVQRRGVGSALLERLRVAARAAGIRRFVGQTLLENHGMRALAKRTGGIARWQGDGVVEHEWSLPD
ncbi:MAG: GNAT family N-acetyltransferase [Chromatiaceae bacterium]|nr:GNAT family N-acetyltransferase [Chromatiaceae bacterium]